MKLGFIPIIATLLVCFSFGSALGGPSKKQCPDPDIRYERTLSGEDYWEDYAQGHISQELRGDKYQCAVYSAQSEDEFLIWNILVSVKEVDDHQNKEAGLIKGISFGLEQTLEYREILRDDKYMWPKLYESFSEGYVSSLEKVTGLKFDTVEEWLAWWKTNKGRLILSKDGKHLVVKK